MNIKNYFRLFSVSLVLSLFVFLASCQKQTRQTILKSPDEKLSVALISAENGRLAYTLKFKSELLIDTSFVGFEFKDQPSLAENLEIVNVSGSTTDESWEMPWGEQREVRNHYNSLIVDIRETVAPRREFQMEFKLYNDGLGFRYNFPNIPETQETIILDENTHFKLTGDHQAWWIPGDWDIYEHLYHHSRLSEIDATALRDHNDLAQTYIPENAVNTPVTMKTDAGIYLSFHEANLTDYADMTIKIDTENFNLVSELVGSDRFGYKVKRLGPFHTPWRTIQVSETAAGLIESNLIVNLNEPNRLGDVSWFQPTKYVGIWWDMHLGTKTWDYTSTQDMNRHSGESAQGKHGATTEYAKELIDFASENNIHGILVEGWNTGWEHWIGFEDREGVFDFVTPYPDYDLKEVVRYGKSKGVELIMHHETSAAPRTYDQQLDTAFRLMQSLGIHSVKTGYVGKIIPKGEYHHGQWMVNHYRRVLETAAKYDIAINAHEPIKATGIRRTLPNAISREGLRGQEFNAWASDGGNPPNHLPTVAFTRMLSGPIDYTPGIFNIKLNPYKPNNQVNTTLVQQLALYVVINSPIQMVPDLLNAYKGHPAFQFVRDVAVNWEQTKVLNGEVGEFVTIARQDRNSDNWFLGAITNEDAREIEVDLDFLEAGKTYAARLYLDAEDAHWDKNPTAYTIVNKEVKKGETLKLKLAAGGGAAVSFMLVE